MTMTPSAFSVLVFGIYMLVQGAVLLVAPNVLLSVLQLPPTNEVWIRATGYALMALGFYYTQAGRHNTKAFFYWTIPVRITQFFVFLFFVISGLVGPVILLTAGLELVSGLWTWAALRRKV
jgi:hypothetical protein